MPVAANLLLEALVVVVVVIPNGVLVVGRLVHPLEVLLLAQRLENNKVAKILIIFIFIMDYILK